MAKASHWTMMAPEKWKVPCILSLEHEASQTLGQLYRYKIPGTHIIEG